jgi:hypothetical protein
MSILQDVASYMERAYENSTPLGARKLCSLVKGMLMSILQDVGLYMGRAYENPTPLAARKLCNLFISMLKSILQDVGTYMVSAYENPNMGYLISTLIDARKLFSLVITMLIWCVLMRIPRP